MSTPSIDDIDEIRDRVSEIVGYTSRSAGREVKMSLGKLAGLIDDVLPWKRRTVTFQGLQMVSRSHQPASADDKVIRLKKLVADIFNVDFTVSADGSHGYAVQRLQEFFRQLLDRYLEERMKMLGKSSSDNVLLAFEGSLLPPSEKKLDLLSLVINHSFSSFIDYNKFDFPANLAHGLLLWSPYNDSQRLIDFAIDSRRILDDPSNLQTLLDLILSKLNSCSHDYLDSIGACTDACVGECCFSGTLDESGKPTGGVKFVEFCSAPYRTLIKMVRSNLYSTRDLLTQASKLIHQSKKSWGYGDPMPDETVDRFRYMIVRAIGSAGFKEVRPLINGSRELSEFRDALLKAEARIQSFVEILTHPDVGMPGIPDCLARLVTEYL